MTEVTSGKVNTHYSYDSNGNLTNVTNGNGTTAAYTYNKANLITEIKNKRSSDWVSNYKYTYGSDGNQLTKTDALTGDTTSYTYDGLNRLTKEAQTGTGAFTNTYTYDDYSNRSQATLDGVVTSYTYDANNRLLSMSGGEIADYTYDAQGNMTQATLTVGDTTRTLDCTYNHFNQLTKICDNSGETVYTYDADGHRASKAGSGGSEQYVWDGDQLVLVYDTSARKATTYIRGLNLAAMVKDDQITYYHYNAHGDVVQLTDSTGNVIRDYTYDAFGVEQNADETDANPFRYSGEQYDAETGNYYLRARYYTPGTGRFTQEDPIRDGLNWYAYCAGNPVAFVDPSGESFWSAIKSGIRGAIHSGEQFFGDSTGINTASAGAAVLNMFEDPNAKGVYHAKFDCWQAAFGYNSLYDFFFDMGTSMKNAYFEFESDGTNYRIWAWKGDYVNLGAGAELGIYKQKTVAGVKLPHWSVDKNLAMTMSLHLENKSGTTLINYAPIEKQWWITGFNSNYKNVQASDLTANFTVFFPETMYNDFYNEFGPNGKKEDSRWTFDSTLKKGVFNFK